MYLRILCNKIFLCNIRNLVSWYAYLAAVRLLILEDRSGGTLNRGGTFIWQSRVHSIRIQCSTMSLSNIGRYLIWLQVFMLSSWPITLGPVIVVCDLSSTGWYRTTCPILRTQNVIVLQGWPASYLPIYKSMSLPAHQNYCQPRATSKPMLVRFLPDWKLYTHYTQSRKNLHQGIIKD